MILIFTLGRCPKDHGFQDRHLESFASHSDASTRFTRQIAQVSSGVFGMNLNTKATSTISFWCNVSMETWIWESMSEAWLGCCWFFGISLQLPDLAIAIDRTAEERLHKPSCQGNKRNQHRLFFHPTVGARGFPGFFLEKRRRGSFEITFQTCTCWENQLWAFQWWILITYCYVHFPTGHIKTSWERTHVLLSAARRLVRIYQASAH